MPSIIFTYGAGQARHSWSRAAEEDTFGHCDRDRSPCGHYEADDEVENLRLLIKQKRVELLFYSGQVLGVLVAVGACLPQRVNNTLSIASSRNLLNQVADL